MELKPRDCDKWRPERGAAAIETHLDLQEGRDHWRAQHRAGQPEGHDNWSAQREADQIDGHYIIIIIINIIVIIIIIV